MKRDMELCRKILFAIEEQHTGLAIYDLKIDGYTPEQIAYHCKILHEANLISDYKALYASNELHGFGVGGLTWAGNDFLDKIREDTVWHKTKDVITKKGLPFVFEVIKDVSSAVISSMTEGAIKGLLGGQS